MKCDKGSVYSWRKPCLYKCDRGRSVIYKPSMYLFVKSCAEFTTSDWHKYPCCWSDNPAFCLDIDYFKESARVRYLRTSCWRIRKRKSERSERVRFLIQKRVRKYRIKHFPCCNLFILYLLRFFNPNQILTLL